MSKNMPELINTIKAGLVSAGRFLERLFTSELVLVAGNMPEILAAARYWRDQLAQAAVKSDGVRRQHLQVEVNEALTTEELDHFEEALAIEFARAKIYCHTSPIFSAHGQEASVHLIFAASAAQVNGKIGYWGYMTRIRITPSQVDREVGAIFDYGKGNWQNVWRKA